MTHVRETKVRFERNAETDAIIDFSNLRRGSTQSTDIDISTSKRESRNELNNGSSKSIQSPFARKSTRRKLSDVVRERNYEACQKLVTKNCFFLNDNDSALLHVLVNNNCPKNKEKKSGKILSLLLEKGANVNVTDENKNTLLHHSARNGHEELCQQLISYQKNQGSQPQFNLVNCDKMTPLHLAAQQGHTKVVRVLLEEGAKADQFDCAKYLPLHYAAEGGHHNCCKLLRHTYPKVITRNCIPPLILAARKGYQLCCQNMNLSKDDLNYQDAKGNTPLHIVSKSGYEKFVEYLVSIGASLNVKNDRGNTPVMEAISRYRTNCLSILIEKGVLLNIVNKQKRGVLHIAAEKRAHECMSILLNDDVVKKKIDSKDIEGYTALLIAIKRDSDKCFRMLQNAGASLKAECNKKLTALHLAAKNRTTHVLQHTLFLRDSNISPKDKVMEQTPLHLAAEKGNLDACVMLLKKGARNDVVDKRGRTALSLSATQGHAEVVALLIQSGANKRALDDRKTTPLHSAAAKGHFNCCKLLLESDQHLCTLRDGKGRYPLDIALQNNNNEVSKFLLHNLPFKRISKLPQLLVKNLHTQTHRAMKKGNRTFLETIAKSRWRDIGFETSKMKHHRAGRCDNFRECIRNYPDLAEMLMDKCIVTIERPVMRADYNFRLLEDDYYIDDDCNEEDQETSCETTVKPRTNRERRDGTDPFDPVTGKLKPRVKEYTLNPLQRKQEHPVNLMVRQGHLNLLRHPLTRAWLTYKRSAYVKMLWLTHVCLQFVFLTLLGLTLSKVRNWTQVLHDFTTSTSSVITRETFCKDLKSEELSMSKLKREEVLDDMGPQNYIISLLFITILLILTEINKVVRLKREYFSSMDNLLRVVALTLTCILAFPQQACGRATLIKPTYVWECGIFAFILSYISLFNMVPPQYSFVTIAHYFKSFVRSVLYVMSVALPFAFVFHLLFQDQHPLSFGTFPKAIIKMGAWMLGDLSHDRYFADKDHLPSYPEFTSFVFLAFVFTVVICIATFIKSPPRDPASLDLYKERWMAEQVLTYDLCYSYFQKRGVIAKMQRA